MENNNEYLTVEDMCRIYQVTKMTVFNWRRDGLPYKKVGKKLIRFDKEEVEKWLENRNSKEK